MTSIITAAFLGLFTAAWSALIWKYNDPGERLFWVVAGNVLITFLPWLMMLDHSGAVDVSQLDSMWMLSGVFGTMLVSAFVGEALSL